MKKNNIKKAIIIAKELMADYDYIYDPDHKHKPHEGGTWYKTEKG